MVRLCLVITEVMKGFRIDIKCKYRFIQNIKRISMKFRIFVYHLRHNFENIYSYVMLNYTFFFFPSTLKMYMPCIMICLKWRASLVGPTKVHCHSKYHLENSSVCIRTTKNDKRRKNVFRKHSFLCCVRLLLPQMT